MSEKRRILALVNGRFKYAEIASAIGRLLLQLRTFILAISLYKINVTSMVNFDYKLTKTISKTLRYLFV